MRDVEDLLLNTLVIKLSEWTGISSGNIWIDRPAAEFINTQEGPQAGRNNAAGRVNFPAISIMYMADTKLIPNNYGESIYVDNGDLTTTAYEPMGEMKFTLGIALFTASKKDEREYGLSLLHNLMDEENSHISYENDSISGEYFGLQYMFKKNAHNQMPYMDVYIVECCARVLKETSGYTVDEITANIETQTVSGEIVEDIIIYDSRTRNDNLIIDTFEEMNEGTLEITEVVDGGNNVIKIWLDNT